MWGWVISQLTNDDSAAFCNFCTEWGCLVSQLPRGDSDGEGAVNAGEAGEISHIARADVRALAMGPASSCSRSGFGRAAGWPCL